MGVARDVPRVQAAPGVAPTFARAAQRPRATPTGHALMSLLGNHARSLHLWHLALTRNPVSARTLTGNEYRDYSRRRAAIRRMLSGQPWWTEMAMTDQQQQAIDSFYATRQRDHGQDHDAAGRVGHGAKRGAKGGRCECEWTAAARYTWRKATSVEISGTRFPAQTDVRRRRRQEEVVLRLHRRATSLACTSTSASSAAANEPAAEALIGTRYVTLNNSIQDKSYIRQTLGYRMLDMAGLPHSRCNYARVFVNGTPIGEGLGGVNCPRHLRQRRAGHEALHRTQLQRQHERQSVRDRAHRRFPRRPTALHRGRGPLRVRGQGRPEVRVQAHQGERACRRRRDARYGAVPQGLRDGVFPQALGRLRQQHQQHLSLQRRHRRRVARRRQHQVQDDPVGYRPDTATRRGLQARP